MLIFVTDWNEVKVNIEKVIITAESVILTSPFSNFEQAYQQNAEQRLLLFGMHKLFWISNSTKYDMKGN